MPGKLSDVATKEYLECIAQLPIASINDDAELLVVQEHVREVLARHKRSERPDGVRAYLDTQTCLIQLYMRHRLQILALGGKSDGEVLRFILASARTLEEPPMTVDDLSKHTGAPPMFYLDVLNGKAELTRDDIADLSDLPNVVPNMFDFSEVAGVMPGRLRLREVHGGGYQIWDRQTELAIDIPEAITTLASDYDDQTYYIEIGQRGFVRELVRRLRDDPETSGLVFQEFGRIHGKDWSNRRKVPTP